MSYRAPVADMLFGMKELAGLEAVAKLPARFYADHILSRVPGQPDSIVDGAAGVTGMALESF